MEADRGTKGIETKGKGKAGKSERMEPYENVLTNSPIQKEIVARLRREQAPGDDQAPAVHEMSPPGLETRDLTEKLGSAAGASEDVPPEGCSTAQLRDFVIGKFQANAKNLHDFEAMITEKFHNLDRADADAGARIQALDPLLPHARDLGVFDQMKVLVKQEEFKSRNNEIQQALQKLDAHLQEMKEKINGYVVKVEGVEGEFKDHVGKAFRIVEEECTNIKKIVEVTNANLQETAGTSSAVTQLQLSALQSRVQTMEAKSANAQESASTSNVVTQLLGALQDRVQTLEAKTTGDFIMDNPNLKGLMYDYGVLKAAVAELQGLMSRGYAAAASDGGGGQGGWQASAPTSGAGCNHCWHVDDHERRITAIEQRVNNPGGDPWWAGAQRAAAGHAAPPRCAQADHQPPGARAPHARHIPPNTEFPDLKDYNLNKLFDDKIALSQEYTYNGTTGGQQWRRKVRGYFLAKCPDLQPLLDWAESKEDKIITDEELKAKAAENHWMMELDVKRCSSVVWGFLGICLKDAAHSLYELAPELNGFEAWRVVVNDIYKSQTLRLAGLRRMVRSP